MLLKLFIVGLGGFFGSIARYLLSDATRQWCGDAFPWGTLVVNVLGCLGLGVCWGWIEEAPTLRPEMRLFLTVGLLGGFTTFSTFCGETMQLLRNGQWTWALGSIAGNLMLGLGAVFLGRLLIAKAI
jgi:CrcB protein